MNRHRANGRPATRRVCESPAFQLAPRAVLDELFRRSVSDDEWRERYEPLLA